MSEIHFSGERVIPGRVEEGLWHEHVARYALAARLAPGLQVLDHACGTGYGSALLLAAGAASVVGLDRSRSAIDYARKAVSAPRLSFVVGDCLAVPFADHSFDLVTAFEIIEHLEPTQQFLDGIARLLRPDGLLLLSTPNRETYGESRRGEANPFHVREFDRRELLGELHRHFPSVRLLGQWTLDGDGDAMGDEVWRLHQRSGSAAEDAGFFIALCSRNEAASPPARQAFYATATNRLRAATRRIVQLQDELEERTSWARALDQQVSDFERSTAALRDRVHDLEERLGRDRSTPGSREVPASWLVKLHDRLLAMATELEVAAAEVAVDAPSDDIRHRWAEVLHRRAARYLARSADPPHPSPSTSQGLQERLSVGPAAGAFPGSPALPAPPPPPAPGIPLLFVQSGSVEIASGTLRVLIQRLFSDPQITLISHHPAAVPSVKVLPEASRVLTATSWGDFVRLRWSLRRQRFGAVVSLWSNEGGYRRLKLFALTFTPRRLFIFNENFDGFRFGTRPVFRHLSWRVGTGRGLLHKVRTGLRVIRRDGFGTFLRLVRGDLRRISPPRTARRMKAGLRRRVRKVEFPLSSQPRVSVVIPARNQWVYTYNCLLSILETAHALEYEVIVVDNASTDRTPRMLEKLRNVRVIRLPENQGFVDACNSGAAEARGDYILFLNNDILLAPGCLQEMIATFQHYPDCGIVGPKMLYPDGLLQEAGGIVWQDGTAWNYGKFGDPTAPEYNYVREVDYVSGAALMIQRSVFERLGGFDQRYAPGYWEDTDLGFSVRKLGLRVYYQPRAELVHFEGITAGRSTKSGMKRFQEINVEKFRDKWKRQLADQVSHDPELQSLARDRTRQPAVLVIDHHVPTWDHDAGSYVMYRVLRALRNIGYRVVLWPDNLYAVPEYTPHLQQLGVEVLYGPLRFESYLARRGRFFAAAVVHRSSMADRYLPALVGTIPWIVYICADLEHLREARRVAACGTGELDELGSQRIEELWRREVRVLDRVDRVAVHSPVEKALLAERLPGRAVEVLPLPVRPKTIGAAGFHQRNGLLFVGSSHPPNVDALEFWRHAVAPCLRETLPGVVLDVVGEACRGLTGLRRSERSTLRLHGFVADLADFYDSRRIFVAPLRYGAGVKGKILEAMASGVPVVTTSVGAEGIEIEPGESALVADDPADLAEAVRRLYLDADLWQHLRRHGLALIQRHYGEQAFESRVQRLIGELPSIRSSRRGTG
jgi:GT2 family glycosyltransferase/SAM-dependent methyltransferase